MPSWPFQSDCNWICTSKNYCVCSINFWFSLIGFVIDCNHNTLVLLICTLYTKYFCKIELNWIESYLARSGINMILWIWLMLIHTRNKNSFFLAPSYSSPLLFRLKIVWSTLLRWCPKWIGFQCLVKAKYISKPKISMNDFNWMIYFVFAFYVRFFCSFSIFQSK